MITVDELQKQTADVNRAHGFGTNRSEIDRALLLAVGELIEAQNELRAGHPPDLIYFSTDEEGQQKPEGLPIELADAIIRSLNLLSDLGVSAEYVLLLKHYYNAGRAYKHGGKAF